MPADIEAALAVGSVPANEGTHRRAANQLVDRRGEVGSALAKLEEMAQVEGV